MTKALLRAVGHCQWLRFGVRNRLIRALYDPASCPADQFSVPFFGFTYSGRLDSFIDWNVFFFGAYASDELALIAACLSASDDRTLVDVGANVGNHALFAATRAARVLAVEPYGLVRRQLEARLAENAVKNVLVCPVAFGSSSHLERYVRPSGCNQGTGGFIQGTTECEDGEAHLEVRRGDDVLAEVGFGNVSMIKIDTEGYEVHVLSGLSHTLAASRPIVLFEWSQGPAASRKEACSRLFPDEYVFFELCGDRTWGIFFRRAGFVLSPLSSDWPNGNIVGIPAEIAQSERFLSELRRQNGLIACMRYSANEYERRRECS